MGQLINAKIQVTGMSSDAGKWTILAGQDKYSFFENKRDGGQSQAFVTMKELGVSIGSEVGIAYDINTVKNQHGGMSNYKNIKMFVSPDDIQMQDRNLPPQQTSTPHAQLQRTQPVARPATQQQTQLRDFYQEALGKCRYGFMLEAYKLGKELDTALLLDINEWAEAAMTGKLVEDVEAMDDFDRAMSNDEPYDYQQD